MKRQDNESLAGVLMFAFILKFQRVIPRLREEGSRAKHAGIRTAASLV
jgi:hypothetical protein